MKLQNEVRRGGKNYDEMAAQQKCEDVAMTKHHPTRVFFTGALPFRVPGEAGRAEGLPRHAPGTFTRT